MKRERPFQFVDGKKADYYSWSHLPTAITKDKKIIVAGLSHDGHIYMYVCM